MLRLLLVSLGGILALKAAAQMTRRRPKGIGLLLFLLTWPGVIPDPFRERRPPQIIDAGRFLAAWGRMAFGAGSVVLLAVYTPRIPDGILGLAGVAALLLTVHLGIGDLLPWLLR